MTVIRRIVLNWIQWRRWRALDPDTLEPMVLPAWFPRPMTEAEVDQL